MTLAPEKKIDEDMVRYFVWAIWNFFSRTTNIDPEVEAPYLLTNLPHNDFTGVIAVAGSQHGKVSFTLGNDLLTVLMDDHYAKGFESSLQELDEDEEEKLRVDATGEMANVIAGNVRNFLGENFLISTPVVLRRGGELIDPLSDSVSVVFPIRWQEHLCHLVVSLRGAVEQA